jgi:sugar phosphate isomerase/epimerase
MMTQTRRDFLTASALTAGAALASPLRTLAQANSPFRVSVITDEISNDFDHACSVAANDFGMKWVELRSLWGKTVTDLDSTDVGRAQEVLGKYSLRVTDIASPFFKVNWPGAPASKFGGRNQPPTDFKEQDALLVRSIARAKDFQTDKIRCFDFWRLDDPAPYRDAMDKKLREAVETTEAAGIHLVLENELDCNTATGREAARTLAAVPGLALNWDPGNAVLRGELDAFPAGWQALPKDRILHCHVKNGARDASGKLGWSPVDIGIIDWTAQFRALKDAGYHAAVSLETHWRSGKGPEDSSRVSWAGMKKCLIAAGAL